MTKESFPSDEERMRNVAARNVPAPVRVSVDQVALIAAGLTTRGYDQPQRIAILANDIAEAVVAECVKREGQRAEKHKAALDAELGRMKRAAEDAQSAAMLRRPAVEPLKSSLNDD